MTFSEWVEAQAERDDPLGDFARDCVADPDWPKRGSLDDYREYLSFEAHADDWTRRFLDEAWAEYERDERGCD